MARTLTPDVTAYAVAAVTLYAAASQTVGAHVHARWLAARGVRLVHAQIGALALAAVAGVALLGHVVLGTSVAGAVAGVPLGVGAGVAVTYADGWIVRHARPRRMPATARGVRASRPAGALPRPTRRTLGLDAIDRGFRPSAADFRVAIGWLVALAALEEVVYRGVLYRLALRPDRLALRVLALAGVTVLFALVHVFYGWTQVLAKTPLGVVALLGTVCTGTIVAAVVAHVTFNAAVWRRYGAVR